MKTHSGDCVLCGIYLIRVFKKFNLIPSSDNLLSLYCNVSLFHFRDKFPRYIENKEAKKYMWA